MELAGLAVAAGCACFAGYEAALIKEWSPADIPDAVLADFERLVSETTLALAEGERDQTALRGRLMALAAPLERWCDEHPHLAAGLSITVQQLYGRLVLRSPEPTAP